MASRLATVLVIFVIAVIAFCLASVCASMTGTISILPNGTGNGPAILDNLSAITDGTGDTGVSYGNEHKDYSGSSSSNVETTVDNSAHSSDTSGADQSQDDSHQSDSPDKDKDQGDTQSQVETTVG